MQCCAVSTNSEPKSSNWGFHWLIAYAHLMPVIRAPYR